MVRRPAPGFHFSRSWAVWRRLAWQLLACTAVLMLFGIGFWLIEPTTPRLVDGLWLAFVTASTIGYGDLVPTTTASRALAVPVLLLGFGMLSMVTAAIAAMWVGSEERRIEREILHDLHAQMRQLREEIASLRAAPRREDEASATERSR
jgi:voltage-gated potassium channel